MGESLKNWRRQLSARGVWLILLLAGCGATLFAAGAAAGVTPAAHVFAQANALYAAGDYVTAAQLYEAVLQGNAAGGAVYYNLGTAYAKQGKWGLAVLNYERAGWYMPRDPDLVANYAYVRSQLRPDSTAELQAVWYALLRRWSRRLAVNAVCWWLLVSVYLGGAAGIAVLCLPRARQWRLAAVFAGILCLSSAALWLTRVHDARWRQSAVVIVPELQTTFAPTPHAAEHLRLAEGAMVTVQEQRGDWLRIRTAAGVLSWAPAAHIARLTPG